MAPGWYNQDGPGARSSSVHGRGIVETAGGVSIRRSEDREMATPALQASIHLRGLLALPGGRRPPRDDRRRALRVTRAQVAKHQIVLGNLYSSREPFVYENRLGYFLPAPLMWSSPMRTSSSRTCSSSRTSAPRSFRNLAHFGAPDLVVEILSESTRKEGRDHQAKLYDGWGSVNTGSSIRTRGRSGSMGPATAGSSGRPSCRRPGIGWRRLSCRG